MEEEMESIFDEYAGLISAAETEQARLNAEREAEQRALEERRQQDLKQREIAAQEGRRRVARLEKRTVAAAELLEQANIRPEVRIVESKAGGRGSRNTSVASWLWRATQSPKESEPGPSIPGWSIVPYSVAIGSRTVKKQVQTDPDSRHGMSTVEVEEDILAKYFMTPRGIFHHIGFLSDGAEVSSTDMQPGLVGALNLQDMEKSVIRRLVRHGLVHAAGLQPVDKSLRVIHQQQQRSGD
jgi:hypothetical protein